MKGPVIPSSYSEWFQCITVECGIELTPEYVSERISALQNKDSFQTKKFVDLYGLQHLQKTLGWFLQAQQMLATDSQ